MRLQNTDVILQLPMVSTTAVRYLLCLTKKHIVLHLIINNNVLVRTAFDYVVQMS